MGTFSEVVDAADGLSVDEQETLLEILRRRIANRKRAILVQEVAEARAEFRAGKARVTSIGDMMAEVCRES